MAEVPQIPNFERPQIHREDLQRIYLLLRNLQTYFNDNYDIRGQAPFFPFPTQYDIFPAIVLPLDNEQAIDYSDGIRCSVARGSMLENVQTGDQFISAIQQITAFQEVVTASNLANLPPINSNDPPTFGPATTGNFLGTGGGAMPPAGTVLLCIGINNQGTLTFSGYGPVSQGSAQTVQYVFWWQASGVVVQINSVVSGAGGKYNGTIYGGLMTDSGTGNLSLPDGLTAGASCLVLHQREQDTVGTHWLLTGSSDNYASGVYWGMSTEATPRPIILIPCGVPRIDSPQLLSCPAPNIDSAATDSWDRKRVTSGNAFGDVPLSFQFVARVGYNPADTTPTLGYFYRVATYATDGTLDTVSDETFVSVNQPDSCSS